MWQIWIWLVVFQRETVNYTGQKRDIFIWTPGHGQNGTLYV